MNTEFGKRNLKYFILFMDFMAMSLISFPTHTISIYFSEIKPPIICKILIEI